VIDPGLDYSTFLGGELIDFGEGIAVDKSGSAYVTGLTQSADYPTTPGAFDITDNGDKDVFVTKLNASGSELVYSTLLGGAAFDRGLGIAVDGSGRAYVTGYTESDNYPTTTGAYDFSFNGGFTDAFVTKLNASGSALAYSTFLGGTSPDFGFGIAVDGEGRAYVTGSTSSPDYPTTRGAFDRTFTGASNTLVTKLNASGSALVYSTYLGGSGGGDAGSGIAVDTTGRAYVAGQTSSVDFPTTRGAFDRTLDRNFNEDAFVTTLNASGSELVYSTFLGGRFRDWSNGIAVDGSGRAYVTGYTESDNYPTTPNAFDTTSDGFSDAFVTKLNASGSALAYSTFLGGSGMEQSFAIAVGERGRAYVTGLTIDSNDYPTTPGAFDDTYSGRGDDPFVTKLPTG
jgi:hypothetical protein